MKCAAIFLSSFLVMFTSLFASESQVGQVSRFFESEDYSSLLRENRDLKEKLQRSYGREQEALKELQKFNKVITEFHQGHLKLVKNFQEIKNANLVEYQKQTEEIKRLTLLLQAYQDRYGYGLAGQALQLQDRGKR